MGTSKQTLYERLGVPVHASVDEIRQGFVARMAELEARRPVPADLTLQRQALRLALSTLCSRIEREAYDQRLAQEQAALRRPLTAEAAPTVVPPPLVAVVREPASSAWMTLLKTSFTRVLVFFGLLALLNVLFNVYMARVAVDTMSKPVLDEYEASHGVRPANRAEAERLEREQREQAQARAEAERAAWEQARRVREAEEAERRFEQEARRRGEQVSAELARAEREAERTLLGPPPR